MQNLKWFAKHTKRSLSASEMRAVEVNTEALGVSSREMMEMAGYAVAMHVRRLFKNAKNILVVCGNGNNGGDGFVAARMLENSYRVTVALIGSNEEIRKEPAAQEFKELATANPFVSIIENAEEVMGNLCSQNDIIIDAIFGTGFHGALKHNAEIAIRKINESKKPVVAVDVPSGLDATTGNEKNAAKAKYTITFYKLKTGLLGSKKAGNIVVADIGIPLAAELFAGPGDLLKAAPKRSLESTKRDNGRVLIIAGSVEFHGAPVLAATAAQSTLATLRVGAGYAVLYMPNTVKAIAQKISPNLIVRGFGNKNIGEGQFEDIKKEIEKADAVAIGMGIGRAPETLEMAKKIIIYARAKGKKTVVDADAIYALNKTTKLGSSIIVTPNDHEFEFLNGKATGKEIEERAKQAVDLAEKISANIVLKGHISIITNGSIVKLNKAETAALATMGTGDVLSGIIAGYAATGASAFDSAVAGVYLHAHIGDSIAKIKGNHILASDIVEQIPYFIKQYDKQ